MSSGYVSLSAPMRLGDRLLDAGLITRTQLDAALEDQRRLPGRPRLGRALVIRGFLAEGELTKVLGIHLGIPLLPFPLGDADAAATRLLSPAAARAHRVVPCRRFGSSVLVAAADPVPSDRLREIEALSGCPVLVYLTPEPDLDAALSRWYADDEAPAHRDRHAELRTLGEAVLRLVEDHAELEARVAAAHVRRQSLVEERRALRRELETALAETHDLLGALTEFTRAASKI